MSAYIWSDPDLDGLQFCATHGCGELIAVHDHGNYAALATQSRRRARLEHFATSELARRAAESYLWRQGITP